MTTIPDAARPTPIPAFRSALAFVEPSTGRLSTPAQQQQERLRSYINGAGRVIPCSAASSSNLITLTPNDASPSLEAYVFGDCFPFWADANSTGPVTAAVVLVSRGGVPAGSLATLKVYVTNGSAQADAGDLTSGLLYIAWYVPILDGNNGGFVLK